MHSRRGSNNDFGNDQRAYFQALYHDILDKRASQYGNIFMTVGNETPGKNPELVDSSINDSLADQDAKGMFETNAIEGFHSGTDWSAGEFSMFAHLASDFVQLHEDPVHDPIGEEISPPPLTLSSSSASEKDAVPEFAGPLELRKVRSKTPSGSTTQSKPKPSSSAIMRSELGGSSKVRKGPSSKQRPKEITKRVSHPNQYVLAQERAQPDILKTIFMHRKSLSSDSFAGITYTPMSILTLNPADLIGSVCRIYSIDPDSISPISIWHDPQTGVHGIVDETFVKKLVNDQDIVFDLCFTQGDTGDTGANAPGDELLKLRPFILLEI